MASIHVKYPSSGNIAYVWRLLDLSGITKTVRQSRDVTLAGLVFVNGTRANRKTTVTAGDQITLEVRYPNGIITSKYLFIENRTFSNTARRY